MSDKDLIGLIRSERPSRESLRRAVVASLSLDEEARFEGRDPESRCHKDSRSYKPWQRQRQEIESRKYMNLL